MKHELVLFFSVLLGLPALSADTASTNAPPASIAVDENTDEIDLEEIDDSADAAAKAPVVKAAEGESATLVDITCDNATLADILRQFRKATDANIISDDSTNLQRRVSVNLHRVPWLSGLQSILNSRNYRLEERGDIYFVKEDKVLEPIVTRSFELKHASAKELADLFNKTYAKKDAKGAVILPIATCFEGANVVVVTAVEKTIADCETIIKAVDKAVAQIYIEARFLELSSEAMHKLGMQWGQLESWGVTAKGMVAGYEANSGKIADYGTVLSQRAGTSTGTESITDSQTGGESGSSKSTNNSKNSSDSTTMAGIVPTALGGAPGAGRDAASMAWRNAAGFSGQLSADDFRLALSAFEEFGEGKIFSNPKIIVSNGKEAKVDMTTKEPNVTVDANYTGTSSQNLSISTKLEVIPGEDKQMFAKEAFFSYGIELSVKPRISPDGLISVEIVPTISEKADDKEIKGAEQSIYTTYPIISVKRLTTEFTMKDGSTAVIGGLTQTVEDDVDSGIPYLRKIPWIGQKLFGWKSRGKVQKEIIVCVTVGIANPADLPKDIGLPKNAVIGREYVNGKRKEPGDSEENSTEILRLNMKPVPHTLESVDREVLKIDIPGDSETNTVNTVSITPSKEAGK